MFFELVEIPRRHEIRGMSIELKIYQGHDRVPASEQTEIFPIDLRCRNLSQSRHNTIARVSPRTAKKQFVF
jgi:hypothetical protein